jgi:hypothetical protein
MKHILLFLAFFTAINSALAETFMIKKEVQCDKTEIMIPVLKGKDFEEFPIWFGKGDAKAPNYSLFVNSETKSWTIIQFNGEFSCVLGSGDGYTIISKKPYT